MGQGVVLPGRVFGLPLTANPAIATHRHCSLVVVFGTCPEQRRPAFPVKGAQEGLFLLCTGPQ